MTDAQLMRKIQNGDIEAFRLLVERYQKRAIGFAVSILGDYQIAEDISQEAFLRVLKSLERYEETGKFEIYFFLIIKNLCLNYLEKKKEKSLEENNFPEEETPEIPLHLLEQKESASQIHTALMQLKEKERILIFLKEYEKLKYTEISEILGLSVSDVKVSIHRALKKLKNVLEESLWNAKK